MADHFQKSNFIFLLVGKNWVKSPLDTLLSFNCIVYEVPMVVSLKLSPSIANAVPKHAEDPEEPVRYQLFLHADLAPRVLHFRLHRGRARREATRQKPKSFSNGNNDLYSIRSQVQCVIATKYCLHTV